VLVYALYVQGLHVLSLQCWHSKMYQWGPEWQRLQCQRIKVVSDLIILNEWSQVPDTAILGKDIVSPGINISRSESRML